MNPVYIFYLLLVLDAFVFLRFKKALKVECPEAYLKLFGFQSGVNPIRKSLNVKKYLKEISKNSEESKSVVKWARKSRVVNWVCIIYAVLGGWFLF